jgi:hypothetical protein
MSNPCPNNTWNHTTGCTCVPNGSVTAEVADIDLMTAPAGPPRADYVRDQSVSIPGGAATASGNILRRALEAGDDPERAYASYDYAIRQIDLLTPGVTQARMTFDNAVEEYAWRKESGTPEPYVTESRRARTEAYLALVKAREGVGYRAPRAATVHSEMGAEPKEMSHA